MECGESRDVLVYWGWSLCVSFCLRGFFITQTELLSPVPGLPLLCEGDISSVQVLQERNGLT